MSMSQLVRRAPVETPIDAVAGQWHLHRTAADSILVALWAAADDSEWAEMMSFWWRQAEIVEWFHGTVASCGRNTQATAPMARCYLRPHCRTDEGGIGTTLLLAVIVIFYGRRLHCRVRACFIRSFSNVHFL